MNWLFYCEGWCYLCSRLWASWMAGATRPRAFIRFTRIQPLCASCSGDKENNYSLKPISRLVLLVAFIYPRLSCLQWSIISQEMSPVWPNWHLLLLITGVWLPFAPAEISPYCVLNTPSPRGRFNKSPFNGVSPQNSFRLLEAVSRLRLCASAQNQLLPGQTSPCQLGSDKQVLQVPAGAPPASSVQSPQLVSISVETSLERADTGRINGQTLSK